MNVIVAGAGAVGGFVADDLRAAGHAVTVIEKDPDLVATAESAHSWDLFLGDACEVTTLAGAGTAKTDVVVAATGEDQVNLVVALLAKQEFGVPRVVARVNDPRNKWLFDASWGVDVAVSTPHLLTASIEEAVSVGSLVRLLEFEGGDTQLIEITLADDAPARDHAIRDLLIPRGATIVAVVRAGRVVVPRGDTVLLPRDEVISLTRTDIEPAVRNIFISPDRDATT